MRRPLVFALNRERVELAEVDPRTTVLEYIRSQPNLQGTKLGCGEGGCGACTVLLSKYDPVSKRVEELTINSCLALLCSIDGCAVTTTEGLRTAKNGFHAVHKRLAGFHGSQCGFCTPGMSMSIYGGLRKASATKVGTPRVGGGQRNVQSVDTCNGSSARVPISALDATNTISGNICRCTGYRPILDACKSFSGDVDVEDLGLNTFWASKQKADVTLLPPYNSEEDPKFPSFLIDELESRRENSPESNCLNFQHVEASDATGGRQWLTAASLSNAFDLLKRYSTENAEVKLVVGNTSAGVYKDTRPQVYIDISHILELQAVKATREGLEVGAGIPLSTLIDLLEAESKSKSVVYEELAKHVRQIASEQVRNRASVGGNLILAQKLGFDSDLATILLGAGSEVTVASAEGQSTLQVQEFLSQGGFQSGRILISVRIPSWYYLSNGPGSPGEKVFFKTYRISSRPNGNAVSYINAAFLAVVDETALVIRNLRLAFGAVGGPYAIRAWKTEKSLVGKPVSPAGLLEAIEVLKEEINPPSTVHKSAYRKSVAVGFLFDFFNSTLLTSNSQLSSVAAPAEEDEDDEVIDHTRTTANGDPSHPPMTDGGSNGIASNGQTGADHSVTDKYSQVVEFGTKAKPIFSTGSQKFVTSTEIWPVAQPKEKALAQLQASGEAVYVDDINPVKGTLYAAFVLCDKRPGKIVSIDASEALKSPGAVDFVSAKDIPGKNIGFSIFLCEDRLFAEDKVECINDTIGLLVADSYKNAKEAASKVKVNVEEEDEGRVNTIDEAIAKGSYQEEIPYFWAHASSTFIGEDVVKGDHRIANGEVYSGSQYHFYMETQTAYAVPDEDGCLTVYSANQSPNDVQKGISLCLGIQMNSVRVITRRLGGSFGGKISKATLVAVACALAASKLKRPVKISLDRQTDMQMCMGRHEAKAVYSVDFNDDGKVVGLQAKVFLNGGRAKDLSPATLHGVASNLLHYNWGSLRLESKICKTNQVNRTIMRAPGEVQGHFIAETIVEHIAAYLGIDAWKVRERNMHSLESLSKYYPYTINNEDSYTLPRIWQKLKEQSQFEKRKLAVRNFNERSKWEKKGIDIVVAIYATAILPRQARVSVFEDGSIVVEVGGIEMGQGLWTKAQQAVAYGLSKLWGPEAHPSESVSTSRIRIVQNDSLSLPHSQPSGGSTTSEASCQAALLACETLVQSLRPFLDKLRESGANPASWDAIIGMALQGGASLTAQGNYLSDELGGYLNYGACVSEISINVLTGSTNILQTDLLYDCGLSLNPAVDIGQIEGAFVMGVGYFLTEELRVEEGKLMSTGTWDYKPPTTSNIPQRFHVELTNTKGGSKRILSSKASGEPPVLLAKSVHSAVRNAIAAAREDLQGLPVLETNEKENGVVPSKQKADAYFRLDSPASIDVVKTLCGLDNVERYLASLPSCG